MPVSDKTAAFCQRCVGFAAGVTYSNYQLTNNGFINPNQLFNRTQDYLGLPWLVDHDQLKQYWLMKMFFPEIQEISYTYITPGVANSTSVSTIDITEIARANQRFLKSICTEDELNTFRLNIPRQVDSKSISEIQRSLDLFEKYKK